MKITRKIKDKIIDQAPAILVWRVEIRDPDHDPLRTDLLFLTHKGAERWMKRYSKSFEDEGFRLAVVGATLWLW